MATKLVKKQTGPQKSRRRRSGSMPSWWAPERGPRRKPKPRKRIKKVEEAVPVAVVVPASVDPTTSTDGKSFAHLPTPLSIGLPAELGIFHHNSHEGWSFRDFARQHGAALSRLIALAHGDTALVARYLGHYGLNSGVVSAKHVQYLMSCLR